jgi:hypothetical protein
VVGSPRSGTTLLRSILDSHPHVCCPTWETGLFDRLSAFVSGDFVKRRGSEANFCSLSRPEVIAWLRRCADDLMGGFLARSGKSRWGEKTPAHVFHMRLIDEVYPGSQFIHIIRDGREVVRSLQNVEWSRHDIRWSVSRWTESVAAGRSAGEHLGPTRYLEVRYEELTRDSRGTVERLCSFLGEPFSESMLEHHKPENNSWGLSLEANQRGPVNRYRGLNAYERLVLYWKAAPWLKELGYV